MHDFQRYFSRTFQDQSDFPGIYWNGIFKRKIQDFPGGVGTLITASRTFCILTATVSTALYMTHITTTVQHVRSASLVDETEMSTEQF